MFKILLIILILYILFSYQVKSRQVSSGRRSEFDGEDPYVILGVNKFSSDEEIKTAYRELSKKNHPDLVTHMAMDFQRLAEEKLKKLNWAFQEIKKVRGF